MMGEYFSKILHFLGIIDLKEFSSLIIR